MTAHRDWPSVRSYDGRRRRSISLPVGGIGTRTIGFGGRGQFRDWEIENLPSVGTASPLTFLACRAAAAGTEPVARILEGDLFADECEGDLGSAVAWAGLPRFERCRFDACYPFGAVALQDDDFPLGVEVEVFNPLAPADAEFSGQPLMSIQVALTNPATTEVTADVLFSVEAFAGRRARQEGRPSRPVAERRDCPVGYLLRDELVDEADEAWGTLAAAVLDDGWAGSTWDRGQVGPGDARPVAQLRPGGPSGRDGYDARARGGGDDLRTICLAGRDARGDSPHCARSDGHRPVPAHLAFPQPAATGRPAAPGRPGARDRTRSATITPWARRTPGTWWSASPPDWTPCGGGPRGSSPAWSRATSRAPSPRRRSPTSARCAPTPSSGPPTAARSRGRDASITPDRVWARAPTSGTTTRRRHTCSGSWRRRCARRSTSTPPGRTGR